jgi:hypothetical protein
MTRFILPCLLFTVSIPLQAALPHGPIRAAYEFSYGKAYSAQVTLPAYQIVDLGKEVRPLAINDDFAILFANDDDDQLIRWRGGEAQLLSDNFRYADWARMNESGSVVSTYMAANNDFQIRFWEGYDQPYCVIDWTGFVSGYPYLFRLRALNDQHQVVMHLESETGFFAFAPYTQFIKTSIVDLLSETANDIATYQYHIDENYDLQQGGTEYAVNAITNYGETVGEVYSDNAYTVGYETIYTYQEQYFALNRDTVLDFEPLQINDHGTVVGRTLGPQFGMVILDGFGQQPLGPALAELESTSPLLSNPVDGLEEIVIGNHYWKRMSECDFAGRLTGQPSPDFRVGTLEDLIADTSLWHTLKASCISDNGRIAGTGRFWNWFTGSWETHGFVLLPQLMLPDWNRDGLIDKEDHAHAALPFPWYFWVNDDDDAGDLARSAGDDLPDSAEPDWESPGMDGLRDIVDFFPVQIDLQPMLAGIQDLEDIEITLSQADAALNFVYTSLLPDEVGGIHTGRLSTGFGPLFSEPLESAPCHPLSSTPVALSQDFLSQLRGENRGILLFEATGPSNQPLVMDYRYKGKRVFTCMLPLSTAPVREMIRTGNIRNADPKFADADAGPWSTQLEDPPNLPDAFLRSFQDPVSSLVHIHGFNWGGDEIPAGHSEIFKRLFQMGCNARYIGVSWFGDQGTLDLTGSSLDYNENVINAFISAGYVQGALGALAGPLTSVFAHSLGNMVASSAIVDHGWDVLNYFMLNAAVPTEAYIGEQDDRRMMVHPDWKDEGDDHADYAEFLLPSNWFALFDPQDRRSLLSWKDRFASICDNVICYNFYSTGEDILRAGNGDMPAFFGDISNTELIWVYNEMNKGTSTLGPTLTGDIHGGWGFNHEYMDWINPGGGAHGGDGEWVPMSTANSATLPSALLVSEPFFRPFSDGDSDFPAWADGAWLYGAMEDANARLPEPPFTSADPDAVKNHAKILAEGLPAHSSPAGSSILPKLPLLRNYDLDKAIRQVDFWPLRSPAEKQNRWLHSDYLIPALPFVAELYQICVESINYNTK